VSVRLNRLRLDRGTILAENARRIESMRRDNRSARILAIPKVVAMQRLNLDLEKKASLGGTRETSFWLWCSVLS
jgi:hypothetical protein